MCGCRCRCGVGVGVGVILGDICGGGYKNNNIGNGDDTDTHKCHTLHSVRGVGFGVGVGVVVGVGVGVCLRVSV